MSDRDPRDIPDLDLPPPRPSSAKLNAVVPPAPAPSAGPPGSFGGDFGMDLDRGPGSAPPASAPGPASRAPAKQIAIAIGDDDEFGLEIERGGAMTSLAPASSARPLGPASRRPESSGLDVAYRRLDPKPVVETGPSTAEKIGAWAVPLVVFVATTGLLTRFAHAPGGRNVMSLLPHAFDATSTVQSGAVALGALVVAIALGFIGARATPRSYAMIGSAVAFLLASLAMVTVTLVSTDENPTPPDGALLIPYVVPVGLLLLGLGIAARGRSLFLDGGARRAGAVAVALFGGGIVFAALEISEIAARLP